MKFKIIFAWLLAVPLWVMAAQQEISRMTLQELSMHVPYLGSPRKSSEKHSPNVSQGLLELRELSEQPATARPMTPEIVFDEKGRVANKTLFADHAVDMIKYFSNQLKSMPELSQQELINKLGVTDAELFAGMIRYIMEIKMQDSMEIKLPERQPSHCPSESNKE
jgi:hypothetical protein